MVTKPGLPEYEKKSGSEHSLVSSGRTRASSYRKLQYQLTAVLAKVHASFDSKESRRKNGDQER